MSKSFKNKYTVLNVPFYLKPFYWLYSYSLGLLVYTFIYWLNKSLTIKTENDEILRTNKNFIYCFWHQDLAGFYATHINQNGFDIINHPAWYMKPIHVLIKCCGVENIYYGSTGNSGKEAANQLAQAIKYGKSTYITPDGPYGPLHTLHKGVLHLSKESQTPIVVVKFNYGKHIKLKGWDRKIIPLPFSKITVRYTELIQVTMENFVECEQLLKEKLA